jgi:hypothetical protein
MRWSDLPLNPSSRMLREFSVLLCVAAGIIAVRPALLHDSELTPVVALGALAVGALGLVVPKAVRPLFLAWLVLAFPVGWAVSRVLLVVLFFGIVTPVSLAFRLFGRDVLQLRRRTGETYWAPKGSATSADSYFRQY